MKTTIAIILDHISLSFVCNSSNLMNIDTIQNVRNITINPLSFIIATAAMAILAMLWMNVDMASCLLLDESSISLNVLCSLVILIMMSMRKYNPTTSTNAILEFQLDNIKPMDIYKKRKIELIYR